MFNIAICDDNQQCLLNLCKMVQAILLKNNIDGNIVCRTHDPKQIENLAKEKKANIFFLDIDLKAHESGYSLAEKIRQIDPNAYIVFVTGHFEFVLKAFKVHSFDYLPKPITDEVLEECILRIFKDYNLKNSPENSNEKYIAVKIGSVVYKIKHSEIIYIEKLTPKTIIHTTSNEIFSYMSLEALEKLLDPLLFIRCHKSFIVNKKYINKICLKSNMIFFNNNQNCFIGNKYKKRLEFI